jgi:hypothetical protein
MYDKVLSELKSGDSISWIKNVLDKGRSIRFSVRLKELIESLDTPFAELNSDHFKSIESTRHYLVHLDEKHSKTALKGEEVYRVNEKLVSLMFKLLKREVELE